MSLKFHSIWSGIVVSINVMPGLVPGIHVFDGCYLISRGWPGTRAFTLAFDELCPAMTEIGLRPRPRLLHEIRPQRLAPVRDRGDLLLPEQDLGLLLHVRLEVRREARVHIDVRERLAEGRL